MTNRTEINIKYSLKALLKKMPHNESLETALDFLTINLVGSKKEESLSLQTEISRRHAQESRGLYKKDSLRDYKTLARKGLVAFINELSINDFEPNIGNFLQESYSHSKSSEGISGVNGTLEFLARNTKLQLTDNQNIGLIAAAAIKSEWFARTLSTALEGRTENQGIKDLSGGVGRIRQIQNPIDSKTKSNISQVFASRLEILKELLNESKEGEINFERIDLKEIVRTSALER